MRRRQQQRLIRLVWMENLPHCHILLPVLIPQLPSRLSLALTPSPSTNI